jgi:hypothetical protein
MARIGKQEVNPIIVKTKATFVKHKIKIVILNA